MQTTQNNQKHLFFLYIALFIGILLGIASILLIARANAESIRTKNIRQPTINRAEWKKIIENFEQSVVKTDPNSLVLLLKETESILRKGARNDSDLSFYLLRLEKVTDTFYEKNIDAIARNLVKKHGEKRYQNSYEKILESQLKAQAGEIFLWNLKNKLIASKWLSLTSNDFEAYVYARYLIDSWKAWNEKWLDASTMQEITSVERGRKPKDENIITDTAKLGRIFSMLAISPWKPEDLTFMRRTIITEKLSKSTLYTRAYLTAHWMFANKPISERVLLKNTLKHETQKQGLSCEANSYAHFYNYYAVIEKQPLTSELAVLEKFPKDPTPLKLIKKPQGGFEKIWWDPNTHFVGSVEWNQSENSNRLTGYGIHATGVLSPLNADLGKIGYTAYETEFSEFEITWNLLSNHPLYFWYVLSLEKKDGFAELHWKTPTWKNITGYVGEHTGIIVGATYQPDGSINQVGYYEWRQSTIVWESYESLEKKAKLFNSMIIARERK
jgi:hypothetical protein